MFVDWKANMNVFISSEKLKMDSNLSSWITWDQEDKKIPNTVINEKIH